jgi:hypothetical protein
MNRPGTGVTDVSIETKSLGPPTWIAGPVARLLAVAFLAGGALMSLTAGANPIPATGGIFLSWHAPSGTPGATDSLWTGCGDPERVDTLYVSVVTPDDLPNVTAMAATICFRAEPPDTLGPFWQFKRGRANEQSMFIEFGPGGFACAQPWRVKGTGAVRYDVVDAGCLEIEYAIPAEHSIPLTPDAQNCVARIRIVEQRRYLGGCTQPVQVSAETVRFEFLDGGTLEFGSESSNTVFWNRRGAPSTAGRSG